MKASTEIREWKSLSEALLQRERYLMHLLVRSPRGAVDAQMVAQVRMEIDLLRQEADSLLEQARAGRSSR